MYDISGPTENAFIWRWTDGISELKSFHILCCCARFKKVKGLSYGTWSCSCDLEDVSLVIRKASSVLKNSELKKPFGEDALT